jgi:hypothetical protein
MVLELPALSVAVTVNVAFVIFFDVLVALVHTGFDEAIAEYERVLRINPRYPLAHYRLALAYEGENARIAPDSLRGVSRRLGRRRPDVPEIVSAQRKFAALH